MEGIGNDSSPFPPSSFSPSYLVTPPSFPSSLRPVKFYLYSGLLELRVRESESNLVPWQKLPLFGQIVRIERGGKGS